MRNSFHPVIRAAAKLISYVFHPLFIPVYVGWFFIYVAQLFPERSGWQKTLLLITFFINYTLLPLVTLLLARGLGFVQSIYLQSQRDRIIPFIATGVFYFWIWYVFRNQKSPDEVVMFALAVFLASSAGLIANIYLKISMHMLAVGVVFTLFLIMGLTSTLNFGGYLSLILLLAGLVATARLVNGDHNPVEVYAGFFVGAVCQLIAYVFV